MSGERGGGWVVRIVLGTRSAQRCDLCSERSWNASGNPRSVDSTHVDVHSSSVGSQVAASCSSEVALLARRYALARRRRGIHRDRRRPLDIRSSGWITF